MSEKRVGTWSKVWLCACTRRSPWNAQDKKWCELCGFERPGVPTEEPVSVSETSAADSVGEGYRELFNGKDRLRYGDEYSGALNGWEWDPLQEGLHNLNYVWTIRYRRKITQESPEPARGYWMWLVGVTQSLDNRLKVLEAGQSLLREVEEFKADMGRPISEIGVKPAPSEQASSPREQEVTVAGNPSDRLRAVMAELVHGIDRWAADEDGIPEEMGEAYCAARILLGWEFTGGVDSAALAALQAGPTPEPNASCPPQATAEPHSKKSASGSEVSKEEELLEGWIESDESAYFVAIEVVGTPLPQGTRVFITTSDPRSHSKEGERL